MCYRICEREEVSLPAMVCFDGFVISHVSEKVEIPPQKSVDEFLPQTDSPARPILDCERPLQFGEVLYPDAYPAFEYRKHEALLRFKNHFYLTSDDFYNKFGRKYSPIESIFTDDAEDIFIAMGAAASTTRWVLNRLRNEGKKVGLLKINLFRPFPEEELRRVCGGAKRVMVLDRAVGYGTTGLVYPDVCRSLFVADDHPICLDFIVGLGGKDISPKTIMKCYEQSLKYDSMPEDYTFWPDR
jgi:pyruvate ferredoxin oxidoreductase alpha subunit